MNAFNISGRNNVMRLVYSGVFKTLAGKDEEALEIRKSTVRDILASLEKSYPGFLREAEKKDDLLLKNGVNISGLRGFDTILTDKDTLAFSPVVLGG